MRWTSAHRYKHQAEAQIERVCRRAVRDDIAEPAVLEALMLELAAEGDAELWAACEAAGRNVLATIWKIALYEADVRTSSPPES
jgi:hypothetical protein